MIKTKFQIPKKNEEIISKPELECLLDDTIVPCIIIKAMSGFGKTTVFAEMAGKNRKRVRWYTLDMTDNDCSSFLSCLENIWETVDGEICETAMEEIDAQQRLLALVQRTQRWQNGIYLILDNLQMLVSDEVIQKLLLLQQYTERKIMFILLTSGEVPKGFLPLLLKGKGMLLSEDALRLTPDEVWKYWGGTAGFTREEVRQITGDLCGWPLGIRCVLEYLHSLDGTRETDRSGRQQKGRKRNFPDWNRVLQETLLSAYLDEILWDKCSGELQAFLAQTATLGRFSREMCHEVLEGSFTYRMFEDVVSHHGILASVPDCEGYYQYGRAFEQYLSCKLSDREKSGLYCRAAQWCRKKGDFMGLAAYAVSGGQDRFLLLTMEQYGEELLCERNQTALGIIIEYLEQNAVLLLPEAASIVAQFFYSQGNFSKMEGYLNAADSSFGKENKYACYRSLYRGLLKLEEDQRKYEKQILNALFFLKESHARLPYLREQEKEKLRELMDREEGRKRQTLKVDTFGTFRAIALRDGKELAWRTKKGRELFAYLLDLEGKAVERRKLIEMLWQDEIPDHAVAMLHNMIYNIRKELSAYRLETILTYENRKYRLSTDEIVCDFSHIRKMAGLVEAKEAAGLRKEYRSFLQYWGTYLEDIDSPWAEEKRCYYDEMFKQGCWILAGQFAEEQDYETALTLYANILSLDPYSEKAVEKMLLLYGKQKRWEKVRQCYHNFKNILEKDLGITPGEEVLAAYHTYL